MSAADAHVEPVAAEPQPDRTLIMPLILDIERLRGDLTAAANWLLGNWPAGYQAPSFTGAAVGPGGIRIVFHVMNTDELTTIRSVLEADAQWGEPDTTQMGGQLFTSFTRRFGSVRVEVTATAEMWAAAFPDEATA